MKLFKIGYALTGFLLAACTAFTGSYGLSKTDREIYRRALSLESDMEKMGFSEFSLADYKVRFYNGNCDYVVEGENISKEDAVLDVFAGTVWEVEGEYQVLIPTYEKFSSLFDMLGAAGTVSQSMSEGTMAFTEESYSENAHVATIWHEAFHAWQTNRWQDEIDALMKRVNLSAEDNREDIIVREADENPKAAALFEEEMVLLAKAYEGEGEEKKEYILKALSLAEMRREILPDSANAMEFYLENLEGSARYVESLAYRSLEGDKAWEEHYMGEFSYEKGSGKYYQMGMLKGLLLDQTGVLLDVMMPGMDGFSVLRKIREISKIPALMMTARTEDYDKILGLELGADDYITKPYNPLEVMARIKAQLRRCYDYQEEKKGEGEILKAFGLELNLRECSLKKQGREIALTKTEFKILELLMKSPGRIYTKQQIFEYSWEEPFMGDEGTVMVHISNLRNKIEDEPKKPEMIRTVKGLGYRFEKEQL